MDKRYQVFVSSTFEDLQEERKEVIQALLELDCIPAGMELFQASDDDQWTLIKNVIDDCDYYLLILGGRYGSTNEDGKSYTQMEYEYALKKGKPIIAFVHKNPEEIPVGKSEKDPDKKKKLEEFKKLVQKKLIKHWDTPENLGSAVSRSMIKLIKNHPAEGWVKANTVVDESSIVEISRLQKENERLKRNLEKVTTEAPKGSEDFAQGEDLVLVEFNFDCNTFDADGFPEAYTEKSEHYYTWNNLFAAIAPNIMVQLDEDSVREYFNRFIEENSEYLSRKSEYEEVNYFDTFKIKQKSFNLLKIQFRALGLIDLFFEEGETYWKLTPHGDYTMTKVLAIKKST